MLQAVPLDDIFSTAISPAVAPRTTSQVASANYQRKEADPMLKPILKDDLPLEQPMILDEPTRSNYRAEKATGSDAEYDEVLEKLKHIEKLIKENKTVNLKWYVYLFLLIYTAASLLLLWFAMKN
jgi:hypothetical protein